MSLSIVPTLTTTSLYTRLFDYSFESVTTSSVLLTYAHPDYGSMIPRAPARARPRPVDDTPNVNFNDDDDGSGSSSCNPATGLNPFLDGPECASDEDNNIWDTIFQGTHNIPSSTQSALQAATTSSDDNNVEVPAVAFDSSATTSSSTINSSYMTGGMAISIIQSTPTAAPFMGRAQKVGGGFAIRPMIALCIIAAGFTAL